MIVSYWISSESINGIDITGRFANLLCLGSTVLSLAEYTLPSLELYAVLIT